MQNKKLLTTLVLGLLILGASKSIASLTFSDSAISGTAPSSIDVGTGNTLSLQTTNNGAITTGTGLTTLGGGLNVTGDVGIGTTVPTSSKLNVLGGAYFSGSINPYTLSASGMGTGLAVIANGSVSTVSVSTKDDTTDNSGQLLILTNNSTTNNTTAGIFFSTQATIGGGVAAFYPFASIYTRFVDHSLISPQSELVFSTSNTALSTTDRMIIKSSGNVGIGTTNPGSKLDVVGDINASTILRLGGKIAFSATAPTISSGFGTSPSIVAGTATAFRVNVGTGGVATSGVIGLPTASTGWNCFATDQTTTSATVFMTKQTASTASSITLGNFNTSGSAAAWTASDVLLVNCVAY